MEDMTEKLSNLDDNGDQLGKHLDLSDGSTHKRCHNEKRSERRARTERLLSDINNDQVNKLWICSLYKNIKARKCCLTAFRCY